jgi:hypothetical protein
VKEREYTDNNNWDSNRDKERHRNGQLGNNRPSREEFCNADGAVVAITMMKKIMNQIVLQIQIRMHLKLLSLHLRIKVQNSIELIWT